MLVVYDLIRDATISKEASTPIIYINGADVKAIKRKDDTKQRC